MIGHSQDKREITRAMAVKMLCGYKHKEIMPILGVSSGYISTWKKAFFQNGVNGLKLAYKGSKGFLDKQQHQDVIEWLQTKDEWTLNKLEYQVASKYGVIFQSKQSYYDLFDEARISWKKTQANNPKHNPELVALKKEICELLERRRPEIETGELVVFIIDECHLLWGNIIGYIWGTRSERISIPVVKDE